MLPAARSEKSVCADRSGFLSGIDAEKIGLAGVLLGGGRLRKNDAVDPSVGIRLQVKTGEVVKPGQLLATVYYNDEARARQTVPMIETAFEITDSPARKPVLIAKRLAGTL